MQLWDAGPVRPYFGRKGDYRVLAGENRRRMVERAARRRGMTVDEYETWQLERDVDVLRRRAEAEICRLLREANRLTSEERRDRDNARARAAYKRDPSTWYAAAYRRRARLKAAAVVEEIRRHDVFERDGWRCRNCGRKVSDKVKRGHKRKAIMAHIVALHAGGDHSWDNVCCLCHECNTKDGVNRIPIQTHLPCK